MSLLKPGEIEFFRANGFLPARPLLSEAEVAALRSAFEAIKEGRSAKKPELSRNMADGDGDYVLQVVNAWEAEDAFRRHLSNALMVESVAELMGTDIVRVWHDQIQYKPPRRGGPTIWHQDFPYWPVLDPPDLVSAWVALEDADEANGCMSMVPRSHLWGTHRSGTVGNTADHGPDYDSTLVPETETVEVVPCPCRAGEVMFHHCMTWHGAPPNRSDRGRPAIAVHYMPGHTRYVPKSRHEVEHLITVQPGEILVGDHFPMVYDGHPIPA